jgi:hypothetical protein
MHTEAMDFVKAQVASYGPFGRVVEFGSQDINGSVRELFGDAEYLGIDVVPGPGVDLVADAAEWKTRRKYDCVVCCEVFEHTPRWPMILERAYEALRLKGLLILTAATDPREPHSAVDGWDLKEGEYYYNVDPLALKGQLTPWFDWMVTTIPRGDVQAWAIK